jgi:hypothetical protein
MDFREIYDACDVAGSANVECFTPTAMVVQQHENMMDDNSPVAKEWVVPDGPCGFAWINIKPATNAFCRWLKEEGIGRQDSYYGGCTIWVSNYNQSMQKKEQYANGFVKKLRELMPNLKAYSMSRMD